MAMRHAIAALIIAGAALVSPTLAADLRSYAPRAAVASIDPGAVDACVSRSAAALAALGYGVWRPTGATVWGRHSSEKMSVGILCDSGFVIVAEGGEFYGNAKIDAALKQVSTAVQDAIAGRSRPAAPAAWTTAPAAVDVSFVLLPRDDWGYDCRTLAHRTGKALGYHATDLYGAPSREAWVEQDAPWFNITFRCPVVAPDQKQGVLMVGVFDPSVPVDRAAALRKITDTVMREAPYAQHTPRLELDQKPYTGDPSSCVIRAAEALSAHGFEVYQASAQTLYGRLARDGAYGPSVALNCAPGGVALIAFAAHPGNADSFYTYTSDVAAALAAPRGAGTPIHWETVSPAPRLRMITRTDSPEHQDCLEGAEPAVGAAAGPASGSYTGNTNGWIGFTNGKDGVRAGIFCGAGWFTGVVVASPRAPADPEQSVRDLMTATLDEAQKPQWKYAGTDGFTVQTPRSSHSAWVDTPAGRRYEITSAFKGATFAAFKLTPSVKAADDTLLNAEVERLRSGGSTIISSKASAFEGNASIVVWSTRPNPGGVATRSTARYLVRRGIVYGIEVTYPEGVDVADAMKTFSERFIVYSS